MGSSRQDPPRSQGLGPAMGPTGGTTVCGGRQPGMGLSVWLRPGLVPPPLECSAEPLLLSLSGSPFPHL